MNKILSIFLICCNFQSLATLPDHGNSHEDSGCKVNDECYKWSKDQCHSEKTIEDLTVALKTISKSSTSRLSGVSSILYHLTFEIVDIFKKSPRREELEKKISKTFEKFEKIVSNQTEAIGIVSAEITKMLKPILSDLLKITEARSVKKKNAAASDLGNHIMVLMDGTAEITQLTSSVSILVIDELDELCQGILSITLATSIILFLVDETLTVQVNDGGFKNDTSSSILTHVTIAVEQFILVLQRISKCPDAESIKQILPTVSASLSTLSTEVSVNISSTIGYIKKYPVPTIMTGILDCIIDSLKNSKHLKDTETAISATVSSLFNITLTILSARLACSFIKGFVGNVDISSRNVLLYVHTIFVLLANMNDDIFSCGNNVAMFLTIMNLAVVKVMHGIDEFIRSILSLKAVTKGGTILMSIFEAVVDVSSSVIQCVAYIFTELKYGLHSVDLPKVIPGIMHNIKSQIEVTRNRLNEKLTAGVSNESDHSAIYNEASTIISSFMEHKRNIIDVVCEGNNANNDIRSAKVDTFIGTIKSAAARLSSDAVGSDIAVKLNEICDESYDALVQLSTVSLKKWEAVKITSFGISNLYYAFVSLSSIRNCW